MAGTANVTSIALFWSRSGRGRSLMPMGRVGDLMAVIGGLNGNVDSVALCSTTFVRTAWDTVGNAACAAR